MHTKYVQRKKNRKNNYFSTELRLLPDAAQVGGAPSPWRRKSLLIGVHLATQAAMFCTCICVNRYTSWFKIAARISSRAFLCC